MSNYLAALMAITANVFILVSTKTQAIAAKSANESIYSSGVIPVDTELGRLCGKDLVEFLATVCENCFADPLPLDAVNLKTECCDFARCKVRDFWPHCCDAKATADYIKAKLEVLEKIQDKRGVYTNCRTASNADEEEDAKLVQKANCCKKVCGKKTVAQMTEIPVGHYRYKPGFNLFCQCEKES